MAALSVCTPSLGEDQDGTKHRCEENLTTLLLASSERIALTHLALLSGVPAVVMTVQAGKDYQQY